MAKQKEKKSTVESVLDHIKRLLRYDSGEAKKKLKLREVGKKIPSRPDNNSAESANKALEDLLKNRN